MGKPCLIQSVGHKGWSDDTPLTAVGERGIRELGLDFASHGIQFIKAFSSDGGRTIQTMGSARGTQFNRTHSLSHR